jgi:DHA2 family multidrug resistance protein
LFRIAEPHISARPTGVRRRRRRGISNSAPHSRNRSNKSIAQFWNPLTAAGRAALDAMITQQAQIVAYIDDYKLLMIATLAVIPLLIVFKQASGGSGSDHASGVEL